MALKEIKVPDIGGFKDVEIIDVLVEQGAQVEVEQPLITLESDKAAMDVPSPHQGTVKELKVNTGDKVSEGSLILTLEVSEADTSSSETKQPEHPKDDQSSEQQRSAEPKSKEAEYQPPPRAQSPTEESKMSDLRRPRNLPSLPSEPPKEAFDKPYAGPAVRHLARDFGVDLAQVPGSGRNGRILKEDVQKFVKQALAEGTTPGLGVPLSGSGHGIPEVPEIDFSQFGDIETQPLKRINKLSAASVYRSWLNAPQVTQFDEADITELEQFRKDLAQEGQKRDIKVTMLAFLLKASVAALKAFPKFNASLDKPQENLIIKKYYHIGVAVDTDNGLVVPVIHDVNFKGLFELAAELSQISHKARAGKLSPQDIQGASFTISSLGGIGGSGFTPIVNVPEVAILGVSRHKMQPVYQQGEFVPRLILPFSVSYDHRVIDGAAAARFTQYLSFILSDVRRLLL
ncbi:MAG: dihydrolipoyllysine-residue acetyltransferase [Pseudomonadota bacterium]|nr:dihydrolipoyllysine-residue acetyltransferase [Pseudomonadota bacterium]